MNTNRVPSVSWLVAFLVILVLLGIIGSIGWIKYHWLSVHVAVVEQQTRYFEEFVEEAGKSSTPEEVSRLIDTARWYSPSLIKQKEGSNLDQIVEHARNLAISNMLQRVERCTIMREQSEG